MINFGVTERKRTDLVHRMQKCGLIEKDLEETFVRSGGAGGQRVNKTSTCVHLKHIPSGLAVKVQKSRSQGLNRYYARKQMCELLENKQPPVKTGGILEFKQSLPAIFFALHCNIFPYC